MGCRRTALLSAEVTSEFSANNYLTGNSSRKTELSLAGHSFFSAKVSSICRDFAEIRRTPLGLARSFLRKVRVSVASRGNTLLHVKVTSAASAKTSHSHGFSQKHAFPTKAAPPSAKGKKRRTSHNATSSLFFFFLYSITLTRMMPSPATAAASMAPAVSARTYI